jgi:hypothetical protein
MNITVKTLEIIQANKSVPLTRAIVKQLPYFRDTKFTVEQVKCIGDVIIDERPVYLIQCPDGLSQYHATPHVKITDGGNIQRYILTK